MEVLITTNLRELLLKVREKNIKKEDIVSIFPNNDKYILIYYK